jgi:hypothetical protein
LELQLAALIVAPSAIAAAISVTIKHVIIYVGEEYSPLKACLYPWIFICLDILSISFQAVGSGIAAGPISDHANRWSLLDAANSVIIAGVVIQVASMILSGFILFKFMRKYQKSKKVSREKAPHQESQYERDRSNPQERKAFCSLASSLAIAFVAVLIRCIYR